MGHSLLVGGEFVQARMHLDRAIMLYDPAVHRQLTTRFAVDIRAVSLCFRSWAVRAASGRLSEIRRSASALVATGPTTFAPQAWSKLFMASPTLNESSTKRTRTPFKFGHPASGGS